MFVQKDCFTGSQLRNIMSLSHNFSNQDNAQEAGKVSPSLQASDIIPSARSYNTKASHQILINHSEKLPSHYPTETNFRDPYWIWNEKQTNPGKSVMGDVQLAIAEDRVMSNQTFNRGKVNHSEGQHSNTKSFLENSGHGNTTVYSQQNVSTFRIYHEQLESKQSGALEYTPAQKASEGATLSMPHFQKLPPNKSHHREILEQYHGSEQTVLYSEGDGRSPAVFGQDVGNAAKKHANLTQNQSLNSHQNGGHEMEIKVGYSTENLKDRYNKTFYIS
jgi:hypothetical protein